MFLKSCWNDYSVVIQYNSVSDVERVFVLMYAVIDGDSPMKLSSIAVVKIDRTGSLVVSCAIIDHDIDVTCSASRAIVAIRISSE